MSGRVDNVVTCRIIRITYLPSSQTSKSGIEKIEFSGGLGYIHKLEFQRVNTKPLHFNDMTDSRYVTCNTLVNADRHGMTQAEQKVLLELEKILQTCNQMY